MIYQFLYFLNNLLSTHVQSKQPEIGHGPVAIRVEGKLKDSRIENNIAIGMRLLEVEEVENSSIKDNKTFLPTPKEVSLVWRVLIDIVVALAVAFVVYRLGWNGAWMGT